MAGSVTNGELNAVELTVVYEQDGTEAIWGTNIPNSYRNGYQEEVIPVGRTMIAWEQSTHAYQGYLFATGFKVHLDDGSVITFGRFVRPYEIQWIRGPLRGVQYHVGNSIPGSP